MDPWIDNAVFLVRELLPPDQVTLGQSCHHWALISSKQGGHSPVWAHLTGLFGASKKRKCFFQKSHLHARHPSAPPPPTTMPSSSSGRSKLARSELFQMLWGGACVRGSINTCRNDSVCLFGGRGQELEEVLPRLP